MTMQNVTLAEFAQMLNRFSFTRNISSIHLHQSRQPNHRTYKGYNSLVEMAQRHRGATLPRGVQRSCAACSCFRAAHLPQMPQRRPLRRHGIVL